MQPDKASFAEAPSGLGDRFRNGLIVVAGAAAIVGLTVATMAALSAPGGWMIEAANQAMFDQQQAVMTSYATNFGD
jgi:hypothetical protein